jgi:hypothetical protein
MKKQQKQEWNDFIEQWNKSKQTHQKQNKNKSENEKITQR